MSSTVKRLLGTTILGGNPVFAPRESHSLLLSAAGGGKTSFGALPWLESLLPDLNQAIVINDCKDGEIAAQVAEMCARYGRNVAIIDEFGVLGEDNPNRVSLSPFGSVRAAHERNDGELAFAIDTANHALIPEPQNDGKNQYFRDEPRTMYEFCIRELLNVDPQLAVPGGVWSMLADPNILLSAARQATEDGDDARRALGAHILDLAENSKEHWGTASRRCAQSAAHLWCWNAAASRRPSCRADP